MDSLKFLSITVLVTCFCVFAPTPLAKRVSDKHFQKISLENAFCGNNKDPYSVYFKKGDPKKLLIFLDAGGVCWNRDTCFGALKTTWLFSRKSYCDDILCSEESPLHARNYSIAILPYCTGDLFLGSHLANYQGKTVRHTGRLNLELSMDALSQLVDFQNAEQLLLMGRSAGAIGVLFNLDLFQEIFSHVPDKKIIADSPGLHFPMKVWQRFSKALLNDFHRAYYRNGFNYRQKDKPLASQLLEFCQQNQDWKLGVLQANKDFIMGRFFGGEALRHHKNSVLGPHGLKEELLNAHDNCASWTPNSIHHGILKKRLKWKIQTRDGVNAIDFVNQVLSEDTYHPSHF